MDHKITLSLDATLLRAARDVALAREITIQQLLKDALKTELARLQRAAKTPNRADERLVARLQRLLAPDMVDATGWRDIQTRLALRGYELRPAGGGLALHDTFNGARICKSSELGFAYSRLVRRFGTPMPGHPHRMAHILGPQAAGSNRPEDDFDLIEPF